jgi:hypothetical protein
MIYANNNTNLPSLFDEIGISAKAIENLTPLVNKAFTRPLHARLIDQLSGGTVNAKKSGQRLFTIYRKENDYPFATVQNRQANGPYLDLFLNEQEFAALPVGSMVKSASSGALGKVETKDAGKLTVSFFANPNGNTSFVAADFAAGTEISDRGAIGNIQNRRDLEFVMGLPDPTQNIVPTYDMTVEILHDDVFTETHLLNRENKPMYAMIKEFEALNRLQRQYVARTLDNVPAVLTGNEPAAASLLNQILTMGGGQSTLGQDEMTTEAFWQDTIERFVSTGSFTNGEIVGIFGQRLFGSFQKALQPYILNTGIRNTIGGQEVKGIEITEYKFGGVHLKAMLEPLYSDTNLWGKNSNGFSRRANTGMLISTDEVMTEQGKSVPFMQSRYFSNTEDIHRWEEHGSIDAKGNNVRVGNGKKAARVNYTLDKVDYFTNPKQTWYIGE